MSEQIWTLCCSVPKSCLTFCNSTGLKHARPPYPSLSPGVCPSSCPLSQWAYPTISSSASLFFFLYPPSFPASGTFPMSQLFALDDQNTEVSASTSVLPVSIQGWFPFRLTGLVSLMSKEISRCSKASILQWSAFFMVQLSQLYMTTRKIIALTIQTFVGRVLSLLFNILSRFVIAFQPRRNCPLI